MTRLTIEGLTKHFGEVAAVDHVDLDIADHELNPSTLMTE
jgi:ABC-type branched-subunit amino acid transport system ATPase component